MKRIISLILALVGLLTAPVAFAQSSTHSPNQQSVYYAVDYGTWALTGQSANLFTFSPGGLCLQSASGTQFFPFATTAPVFIVDATSANNEVVTPSTVTNTSTQCGFTASPSHSHTSFQVKSGTGGLQESINALAVKTSARPATIILDRNWFTAAGSVVGTNPEAILAAATCNSHAIFADIITVPQTTYVCNETNPVAGTWVNTKPAVAAGAGAGSSPTIAVSGTALTPTVALTTGTATTTGTLFTLTWGSNASPTTAQFLAAPTCSVTSSGANPYTTFTSAVTFPSSTHALLTVTVATTAPVASTAYQFKVSCY